MLPSLTDFVVVYLTFGLGCMSTLVHQIEEPTWKELVASFIGIFLWPVYFMDKRQGDGR